MRRNSLQSAADSHGRTVVVVGIDPGTLITGYGVIARTRDRLRLLECGTIRCSGRDRLPTRLQRIYTGLVELFDRHHPDELAIESAFYGKNAQSALKLGHARGVALLAAVERSVPSSEYSPREVKKAIVGSGTASKEQVRYMVTSLLRLRAADLVLDASDALAIALCHLQRLQGSPTPYRDWKSYAETHPERVRS